MAHIETNRPAPLGAITIYSVVSFFSHFGEHLQSLKLARKTSKELRVLSNLQLEDIGLTRAQVSDNNFFR